MALKDGYVFYLLMEREKIEWLMSAIVKMVQLFYDWQYLRLFNNDDAFIVWIIRVEGF